MDSFFALPAKEQVLLLNEAAKRHGHISNKIVEKDFWIYWTLKQLFENYKIAPYIVFKGDTSLSKAYNLINRFSENIDLEIDKNPLNLSVDGGDRMRKDIHNASPYLRNIFENQSTSLLNTSWLPLLNKQFSEVLASKNSNLSIHDGDWSLTISPKDSHIILFHYPQVISYGIRSSEARDLDHIKPVIRLKFSTRGDIFSATTRSFIPYVMEFLPEIFNDHICAKITTTTLEAEYTFWDKVAILHCLYIQPQNKMLKASMAQHYYDIIMLARKGIAINALHRRDLLEVVTKNSRFEYTEPINSIIYQAYDDLLQHNIKLVPVADNITYLKNDYLTMQKNGMFFGDFPSFTEIIKELKELEHILNNN